MTRMTRRRFLTQGVASAGAWAGAAALGGGSLLTTRMVFGAAGGVSEGRFMFIILRGALDGLSAAPPYGDPAYIALRGPLALPIPGSAGGALRLDNLFALHPSLGFLHECFSAQELTVIHAVASPYRERSHFDGQDVLESGVIHPHASESGWLNRALTVQEGAPRRLGVALGTNVPLVMRGPAEVASWSPSQLASLSEDTLQRVTDLYASDMVLSQRLADALASDSIAAEDQPPGGEKITGPGEGDRQAPAGAKHSGAARFVETARAAAGFLGRADGPRVAVLETTGWDTHANEGSAQGQLAQRLAALDAGLREFRPHLVPYGATPPFFWPLSLAAPPQPTARVEPITARDRPRSWSVARSREVECTAIGPRSAPPLSMRDAISNPRLTCARQSKACCTTT